MDQPTAGVAMVTPEFFDLAAARARHGRLLTWHDDGRAEMVAVVNDSFVRKFSPNREVVGRRIRIDALEFGVVGVVRDLLMQDVQDRDGSGVYLSMLQVRPFVVRTMTAAAGAPLAALPAFRAAIQGVDPDLPVLEGASLYDAIYADKQVLDTMAGLFLAFGAGTIFLAVTGLFALLSFTVTARTREFGVRMALGATSRDLTRLVLGHGARELAWGLGIGLLIAVVISRALAASLENVPAAGLDAFAAIVLTVSAGAGLALWNPLRRVVKLSAIKAIRDDG
jgi:putative ABC transport system permease protein